MASEADEETNAASAVVLSDVEDDDHVAVDFNNKNNNSDQSLQQVEEISIERFRELLAELDHERNARLAAENSKTDLQSSFSRLKALAHEAIKKRDESTRQKDEALREKEKALKQNETISKELEEALKAKEEVLRLKNESVQQLDEIGKAKEMLRAETETATQMLVNGIEKISGKVSHFRNFSAGGLPKSQRYNGLPAVAYGIIKRTNEIVEEFLKQYDTAMKSRNEAREQMEQRNYEIAIEVSELEATISGLKEEVAKKTSDLENLEKLVADRDQKISEMDRERLEKQNLAAKEISELKELVIEYDYKLTSLESKMDSQRPLLIDHLNYLSRIRDQINNIVKIVDENQSDQSEFTESSSFPQQMDIEENLQASLALMESTHDFANMAVEKVRGEMQEKLHEAKRLNETVSRLVKEKRHIGSLLRSALPGTLTFDPSSKTGEILQVAENGLREAGIDVKFSNLLDNGKDNASHGKQGSEEVEEDEVYTLAGALENIVKACQLEIMDLQHSVDELRIESSLLKAHVEAQAKELNQRKHCIEELEEKERVANENIEGLMMDIASAEEEITRWKVAAEQEAAAGRAVEQDFLTQLSALRQELDEAKQAMLESEKKLKFKEETAAAAMAARDAAEKSLRLADMRASRLAERVEELSRQLEESDTREDSRTRNRQRYMCWPWQWLGLNFVGYQHTETQQPSSNEMELSEPFL